MPPADDFNHIFDNAIFNQRKAQRNGQNRNGTKTTPAPAGR